MITRVHVDQHVIRANKKNGTNDPPITVKTGRLNLKARRIAIQGPSEVVYSPDKPLSCGARVWVATTAEVVILE